MKSELEQLLHSKHPKIFAAWDLPKSESGMSLGIECGDGWFNLIDALCTSLQDLTDQGSAPQAVAAQVKQKFGELRFYTHEDTSDEQAALIRSAVASSSVTCDECGRPGKRLELGRWRYGIRCSAHSPQSLDKK